MDSKGLEVINLTILCTSVAGRKTEPPQKCKSAVECSNWLPKLDLRQFDNTHVCKHTLEHT